MNNQLSAIEQRISGAVFPQTHLDCIKNAWQTACKIDTYSSWKYVAGILHGAYVFSLMDEPYNSELLLLKEIAFARSLEAHNG